MAVSVRIFDGNGTIGDVVEYSVTEDATPIVVGDTSGSAGQITVTARAVLGGPIPKRTGAVVGSAIELVDTQTIGDAVRSRGEIEGQIKAVSMPGARATVTADTLLNKLNAERTVPGFFGSYTPESVNVLERTNLHTNPSREVNVAGVTATLTGNVTRQTTGGYIGSSFARLNFPAGGVEGAGVVDTLTNLTQLNSYTFSGYYRITRASGTKPNRLRARLTFLNSTGAQVGEHIYGPASQLDINEWRRFSIATARVPAGATQAQFGVVSVAGEGFNVWGNGDNLDSDSLLVEQGGLGPYFDGATAEFTEVNVDTPTLTTDYVQAWTGTAYQSTSRQIATTIARANGYDATEGGAFRYYCSLVGVSAVAVEDDFDERPVAYPGWTGNVWKYLKDFAAAVQGEIALVNGVVTLRRPRLREIPVEQINNPVFSVSAEATSQFVEVLNYNSRWVVDETIHVADTIYTVDQETPLIAEITVPHFLTSVNDPQAVNNYQRNYPAGRGQYMVTDSQDLMVDAAWWEAAGGHIYANVSPTDQNKIELRITSAHGTTEYQGPFKIAFLGGTLPGLTLTGTGVYVDKQAIRIRTGASERDTSTEVGSTIDNVFLSNSNLAFSRGIDAACAAAGQNVSMTGTVSYVKGEGQQQFGYIAGTRFKYRDNIFRITTANITSGGVAFTAIADMTFNDSVDLYAYTFHNFEVDFPGYTFTEYGMLVGNITFAEFDARFESANFTTFDTIYEGASFSDHATYPYIGLED